MNNTFVSCKETRIETPRSFYGCFQLGPFEESQSLTIANALRRTLLSECLGLAIVSVTIENVSHEYSTLPGVKDSILDIVLNLKEIVFKKAENPWRFLKKKGVSFLYEKVGKTFSKPMIGYLKVKGPGIVRAKDLRLPPFVQCVDPNQYIATLCEDGILNMKFVIMEGKGYIVQKSNQMLDFNFVKNRLNLMKQLRNFSTSYSSKEEKVNYGEHKIESFSNATSLMIDAVFNPITKVSYIIETSENKIIDKEKEKLDVLEKISTLLDSSSYLRKNMPSLMTILEKNSNEKNILEKSKIFDELMNYVDTFSDSELISSYHSLHPLSLVQKGSRHSITLEIWTNGSLHPREAMSLAFSNLATVFVNFENMKLGNPIYQESSSYQKIGFVMDDINPTNYSTIS